MYKCKLNISAVSPLLARDGSQAYSNNWKRKFRRQECQQGCKGSAGSSIKLSCEEFFREDVPFVTLKTFSFPTNMGMRGDRQTFTLDQTASGTNTFLVSHTYMHTLLLLQETNICSLFFFFWQLSFKTQVTTSQLYASAKQSSCSLHLFSVFLQRIDRELLHVVPRQSPEA